MDRAIEESLIAAFLCGGFGADGLSSYAVYNAGLGTFATQHTEYSEQFTDERNVSSKAKPVHTLLILPFILSSLLLVAHHGS